MKPVVRIWSFTFCFFVLCNLYAQESNNIVDELNSKNSGEGKVSVYQDEAIRDIAGKPISAASSRPVYSSSDGQTQYVKMRGYKIQVFAGNNPRTSKNEAYSKQALIDNAFPELETVIKFDAPFWRLRVGNFKSRSDANEVMSLLQQRFPSFGKEMYIVMDEVKVSVDDQF